MCGQGDSGLGTCSSLQCVLVGWYHNLRNLHKALVLKTIIRGGSRAAPKGQG